MGVLAGARIRRGRQFVLAATVSASAIVAGGFAFPEQAAAQSNAERRIDVDIPAQDLNSALLQFTQRAGLQIVYTDDKVAGRRSSAVEGRFTPVEALSRMLAGTGLTFRFTGANRVTLEPAPISADGAIQLGPVRVQGAGAITSGLAPSISSDPGATEGTGSYTTRSTSTATGLRLSLKETPQSVTVFTRARLEDQALGEISEVLDQTVGVTASINGTLGTDSTNFYSRGFEIENFQIDGAERPSTIYGFRVNTADMAPYDRIEIVRGATGLLNGVGMPGATVNLIRKKPAHEFQAHISGQLGSWDRYRAEGDVSVPITANGAIRARLVGAYQDNKSFIDREHLKKHVIYGVVEADATDRLLFTVGAEYQRFSYLNGSRYGLPLFYTNGAPADFPRSTNLSANWTENFNRSLNLFSSLKYDLGRDWELKFDGEYSRRKYDDTLGSPSARTIDPVTGLGGTIWIGRWNGELQETYASLRASGPFTLFGREHDLMVGVSYSNSRDAFDDLPLWWTGPEYAVSNYNLLDLIPAGELNKPFLGKLSDARSGTIVKNAAGYAATRLRPLDGVSLILGARLTNWSRQSRNAPAGEPFSPSGPKTKEHGQFAPYAGLLVDIARDVSVYASYTDIFNPQTNEDINGEILPPLKGSNYEAGLKAAFFDGKLNASAAVFHIKQDNFALDTGLFNPKGNTAYEAVSGTTSNGFELEVTGELLRGWQVSGGFSHTKVKDRDDAPLNTYIPVDTFKFFSSYDFSGSLDGLKIGGNFRWHGRAYNEDSRYPNGIFTQDGFVLIDLMARYAVTSHLSLSANLNNIFDQKYYSSFTGTGRYGTPREVLFSAKYSF